jgi:glycosyltransferase involved in cell wall biosynthesis
MRGSFLKGLLYWLSQQPIRLIIKKYADMVFVTSEPDVEKFVTDKRGKDSVVVVHGAVDTRPAERYLNSGGAIPPEKRKYDACYVGRFHYQKGVLELVDIWRLVCERMPSAKLAMIGSGPLENDVKRRIEKFRLGSNIELVGYRDGDAKYEVFKQAKIVVHPATYDSGGMSAAEAMAWRLPGVSFDLESLRTYYPLGMVKVAQGDTSGFAREVIRLLTERGYYEKMAEEARRLAVGAWDWAKRADLIYKKVFKAG